MTAARLRIVVGVLLAVVAVTGGRFYIQHLVYAGAAHELTFRSGGIELAGVLVKPRTPGPHPGIVLLHGSGPQTFDKWHYRIHTNVFVRNGFAVLSYDQRGCGRSQGDFRTATFRDLVGDAIAGVAALRSDPDILPHRVGVFGLSESGWFTPEVAETLGDLAFVINRVSPPLPVIETVLFDVENEALAAGASEAEVEEILTVQRRIWQFYIDVSANPSKANGPEREAINARLTELHENSRLMGVLIAKLPEFGAAWYAARASKTSYDPSLFLEKIEVPMLYILAGRDINVPFAPSLALLEQLKKEHDKDITIETYPEADHYLYRWNLLPLEGLYVPGYLDLIGSWAADHASHTTDG